ncbi:cell division protein [Ferrimonas balearica]|uniref:cell division protein n=1 Tax=Ferrimonas balearica TaxID=44012 RepID=UPI001C999390|nr:cell division protein [Ferrimonas balearica]MBY5923557.1 cell division protein [Ferrimonas balearica]MBY5997894.1 cell division protein [Ferrimonas balearica]
MKTRQGVRREHPGLWQQPGFDWQQINTTAQGDDAGRDALAALAPQLADFSRAPRWLLLINPPAYDWKSVLANAGVDLSRVLQVRCDDDVAAQWALEQAVSGHTCAVALAWVPQLDARDRRRLELVSRRAHCPAFLFEAGQSHPLEIISSLH